MSLLEVEEIYSGYSKEMDILKGVSLEVSENQMVSIIGPNGAGKSTILKAIFGVLEVREGEIFFSGESIVNSSPAELLRQGLCFIPQGKNVFPLMTVRENLELGTFTRSNEDCFEENIRQVYEMFPILEEKKNDRASTLSGGQLQMMEMGRAMLLSPRLVLIDEPSLGLAPNLAKGVFEKIETLKAEGTTILIVEQNADRSLQMSDFAYVIEAGENKYKGDAEEIRTDEEIKRSYLGG